MYTCSVRIESPKRKCSFDFPFVFAFNVSLMNFICSRSLSLGIVRVFAFPIHSISLNFSFVVLCYVSVFVIVVVVVVFTNRGPFFGMLSILLWVKTESSFLVHFIWFVESNIKCARFYLTALCLPFKFSCFYEFFGWKEKRDCVLFAFLTI